MTHRARPTGAVRRTLLARVASNFAWGMVAEGSARGALFLTSVHLAQVLGARYFGEFSFLQTIFVFLWLGVDLGLNMYATREVARSPSDTARLLADPTHSYSRAGVSSKRCRHLPPGNGSAITARRCCAVRRRRSW